jgi:hypothetical protein
MKTPLLHDPSDTRSTPEVAAAVGMVLLGIDAPDATVAEERVNPGKRTPSSATALPEHTRKKYVPFAGKLLTLPRLMSATTTLPDPPVTDPPVSFHALSTINVRQKGPDSVTASVVGCRRST